MVTIVLVHIYIFSLIYDHYTAITGWGALLRHDFVPPRHHQICHWHRISTTVVITANGEVRRFCV